MSSHRAAPVHQRRLASLSAHLVAGESADDDIVADEQQLRALVRHAF